MYIIKRLYILLKLSDSPIRFKITRYKMVHLSNFRYNYVNRRMAAAPNQRRSPRQLVTCICWELVRSEAVCWPSQLSPLATTWLLSRQTVIHVRRNERHSAGSSAMTSWFTHTSVQRVARRAPVCAISHLQFFVPNILSLSHLWSPDTAQAFWSYRSFEQPPFPTTFFRVRCTNCVALHSIEFVWECTCTLFCSC